MYDVAYNPFLGATDDVVSNRGEHTVGFQNAGRSILQNAKTGNNSEFKQRRPRMIFHMDMFHSLNVGMKRSVMVILG